MLTAEDQDNEGSDRDARSLAPWQSSSFVAPNFLPVPSSTTSNEIPFYHNSRPVPSNNYRTHPRNYLGLSIADSLASFQSYHTATGMAWPLESARFTGSVERGLSLYSPYYVPSIDGFIGSPATPGSFVDNFSDDCEVVLDDGTRQKRSVSLSTMPALRLSNHPLGERRMRHSSTDPTERTALLWDHPRRSAGKDSSSDSEDDKDGVPRDASLKRRWRSIAVDSWDALRKHLVFSTKTKLVVKCSFAYLLGSMFTFVPSMNALLGDAAASSSTIATVVLFFNPAKSIGSMLEYTLFGLVYSTGALVLCLLSQFSALYFQTQSYLVLCTVTLGFWLAGSVFGLSFIKAHFANKPSIATACGLASMIIFPVLVREGSPDTEFYHTDKILQLYWIILFGALLSAAVCFTVWPTTATAKLKTDIDASLMSTRVLLKLLTKTFLMDTDLPEFQANQSLADAIESHRTTFTSLETSLLEARHEFLGGYQEYNRVVESLQRLAQHVGGLRSSCGLQFEAIQKSKRKSDKTWRVKADEQRKKIQSELRKEQRADPSCHPFDDNDIYSTSTDNEDDSEREEQGALGQFIQTVRGPMKSLAYTCKQTIMHLQSHFTHQTTPQTPSFTLMKHNLAMAMALFEESQHHALARLYRRCREKKAKDYLPDELHSHLMQRFSANDVFLVYFFVFCLLEFAKELMMLVDCVQHVFEPKPGRWWPFDIEGDVHAAYPIAPGLQDSFVPNNHNTTNTLHTPAPTTTWRKFFLKLWGFFSWFRQHTVRYAAKSMMISVALAAMAFIPATQPYFKSLRMEWTLVTVMAVMTPTVGGTNLVAVLRVLATILGSMVAVIVYMLFPGDGNMLLLLSWIFSVPCFWMILNHKHGRFGQFSLLAYNLVTLYKFNHRNDGEVEVHELAWMRCAAVSAGVIIGLVVTAYIWPFEARKELRKSLSDFLLRLSWLYKQLASEYASTPGKMAGTADNEMHPARWMALVDRNHQRALQFQQVEIALQVNMVELQGLLSHAPNEPRLKGAFPTRTYDAMLQSCQTILDKFLSIRIVILKEVWLQVQRVFVVPASQEWMSMTGNVLLYFYLLASALQLKTPLPPFLPPAEQAREALMTKLQTTMMRSTAPSNAAVRDECYIVYYAYVVAMESIILELEKLGQHMKDLFGTLVPEDQWSGRFGLLDLEQAN